MSTNIGSQARIRGGKMQCTYPDCFKCNLDDCKYEHPAKAKRYEQNFGAEKQRIYRENRRKKLGIKTQKELMVEKQNKMYKFIVDFTSKNLYPPSSVEIQNALGIRGNAEVSRDLHRLEDRGLIKINNGQRTYTLIGYKLVREEVC